ncbi:SigE family RNA polymerase sigma factor [Nocardioides caeni]|uniref:SigE family RNA polymerase sigma factor n=1 Tax=Nocardioides caeni TaxID=574700 RepID=A0A4S8NFU7_9ACTN|nr:SigE family RNA polymerase sigma factor [Nocardioides caeni]
MGTRRRDAEFTEFVVSRRVRLHRTAYLMCGDPHRAEDIVQQALAKLYVSWPRVRRAESVDAYARRSVLNAFLDDGARSSRREVAAEIEDRAQPDRLSHEDADALWDALRELPPGQRRVVVLRHYWGLSVEETAADLGISTGTVKSQTAAALTRLRGALVPADVTGENR